jgi:hypothetical protein
MPLRKQHVKQLQQLLRQLKKVPEKFGKKLKTDFSIQFDV